MGAIYDRASNIIPITWDALAQSSKMGQLALQQEIDTVKLFVTGVNVDENDEEDYDLRVQRYLARLTVLEVIPSGLDYWNDQYQSVSTAGGPGVEMATYQNRIDALKEIQEQQLAKVIQERPIIEEILDTQQYVPSTGVPDTSDGGDELEGFVTPNPNTHFRDYAFPGTRHDRYRGNSSPWPN